MTSVYAARPLLAAIALLLTAFTAQGALPLTLNGDGLPSLAPLVDKTAPAVVNIRTRATVQEAQNPLMNDPFFRRFFGIPEGEGQQPLEREVSAAGSGVIVDAVKGYVLTNHHVVTESDEIKVYLNDDRVFDATIVGTDEGTDIAVIQLKDPKNLTAMRLGNSDKLQVGDYVVAIGNPFGLQHTVTSGIVSALGRRGIQEDGYEDFIQTDASINPGNSGGALISLQGELVGINSAIFSQSGGNIGIGFAIPSNIAKSIMAQILEFGTVKRGLLGVSIRDFGADTAEALGMKTQNYQGALVEEVFPDSPAEKAGIEVGDVIVAVDNQKVKNAGELRTNIGLKRTGESVRITIMRDTQTRVVNATLGESEVEPELVAGDIHSGLVGAEFANYDGVSLPYKGKGVVVTSVAPGSPAEFRGLQPNDVITLINQQPVANVADLQKLAKSQDLLMLKIQRGDRVVLRQIR